MEYRIHSNEESVREIEQRTFMTLAKFSLAIDTRLLCAMQYTSDEDQRSSSTDKTHQRIIEIQDLGSRCPFDASLWSTAQSTEELLFL
ncbi:hypothetical protein KQX54_009255 [Cotesia glomerata]|uniref:Uncharacterized protein n=1 Tax=Cotesia glomerata TaxID=32391 RepID=A0AAV7I8G2_COTGL|nr:hypothetical protein KQX54_009255 [Cotesia glomerata]